MLTMQERGHEKTRVEKSYWTNRKDLFPGSDAGDSTPWIFRNMDTISANMQALHE